MYDLSIALGRRSLAFSYGFPKERLYVSPLAGRERLVARGEYPVGWTRGGFYTWGRVHHRLLLRGEDGAFRKTIAPSVYTYTYADHGLWLIRNGWLLRAVGARVRRVAALGPLGLWPVRHLQLLPLGRLVALEHGRRLVVLRTDGSLFASTNLSYGTAAVDGVSAPPQANHDGTEIAFTTTRGNAGYTSRGSETIYVLGAGDDAARAVYTERNVRWPTCVSGAALSWHGGWLLYASNAGHVTLVAPQSGHAIELTPLIRRLPGVKSNDRALDVNVAWS